MAVDVSQPDVAQPAESPPQRVTARRPLVGVFLAAAAGITLDGVWPLAAAWALALGLAACGVWLFLFCFRRAPRGAVAALLVSTAGLAAAWHHVSWNLFSDDEIGLFAREWSEPVCLRGRVLSAPLVVPAPPFDPMRTVSSGDQSQLALEVDAIRDRGEWITSSGRVRIMIVGHAPPVVPGERLQICGRFSVELPAANPGERDHADDARRDRRLCSVRCETPACLSRMSPDVAGSRIGPWSYLGNAVADLRHRGNRLLWQHLGQEHAGLAAAVLLGDRDEVPRDEVEAYVQTGTVHLLSISGLHVTILALFLSYALRLGWLSRRTGLGLVGGLTFFYALLVDAQPPVVRASLMVGIACAALWFGRRGDGYNALALAGLAVLLINPADLFRVGPQLSFLAVATLIWVARNWGRPQGEDPLTALLARTRPLPLRAVHAVRKEFKRLIVAGFAIALVTLPLTMSVFHLASPLGILLTPILGLPMAVALLSGLGVLLFGWLLPPVASLCGTFCDWSLGLISRLVSLGQQLPGSHFWVPGPPAWWIVGFYAAIGGAALWPRWAPPRKWCVALLSGWIAVGIGAAAWPRGGEQLRCTVLSVGHGSAAVLELPDGRVMVCDAGRLGSPEPAARAVANCLWSQGRRHIDAIIVSHADADHYNAVPRLLTQFSVGAVYVSPVMLESDSRGVAALFDAIKQAGVPIKTTWAGERFDAAPVSIEVLHPPQKGVLTARPTMRDNANCIVLAVQYAGRRLLLPGDIETPGLDDLLAEEPLHCDFLTAPHHGSANNDPEGVTAWCTPQWNVVSGSDDENLTAIRTASKRHGVQLFHTAEDGAVTATVRREGITVEAFRPRGVERPAR